MKGRSLALLLLTLLVAGAAIGQQASLGAPPGQTVVAFRGQNVARRITFVCPATSSISSSVWGSSPYTDDSDVCPAAVHAGALRAGQAGQVTVLTGIGLSSFQGSTQNGLTSQAYTNYQWSYTFDTSGTPGRVDWSTTAQAVPAAFTGTVVVECPPATATALTATIYGTDVYTAEGSICVAAVHAGAITLAGGRVAVTMAGTQSTFPGTERNGVVSQAWNSSWDETFRVEAVAAGTGPSADAVTGLVASADAQGRATLRWNELPSGAYLAMRWKVGDANCCNISSPPGAPLTAATWSAGTLPNAGTYGFRVVAMTANGVQVAETRLQWPTPAGATATGTAPPAGSVVTGAARPTQGPTVMSNAPAATVTITGTATLASLTWTAPPGAVTYTVHRRSGVIPDQVIIDSLAATEYTDKVLPGTSYEYRVTARQSDGSYGQSEWVTFTPPIPNPEGFTARQTGDGEATLEWQPVPDAREYRVDGAGLPNTGRLVGTPGMLVTPLPAGTHSWQVAAVYDGNVTDMTTRPTATLAITVSRPPFLSLTNGPGSAGDASLHTTSSFNPSCDRPRFVDCVKMLDIVSDFGLDAESWRTLGWGSSGGTAHLYSTQFADIRSLATGRSVYCAQKGGGPTISTLCWAAAHGPPPGAPGHGDAAATLAALKTLPAHGITLIEQRFDGLHFAAFETLPSNAGYGTDVWGNVKVSTTLDSEGAKFLPHSCLACHGGTYDPATGRVEGATLLPLDPSLLVFENMAARAGQEESLRIINNMVLRSNPAPVVAEYVRGLYNGDPTVEGRVAKDDFVPAGWSQAPELYQRVVKPYCATCHMALTSRNDFGTYENFFGLKERVKQLVCQTRSMPHAEAAFTTFWTDGGTGSQPAYLMNALGLGSCAP